MKHLLFLLLTAAVAAAQTTGSVSGTVADASGSPIPDAKVVLLNPLTGLQREARTGTDGAFQILNVPAQNYTLTIESAGLQTIRQQVSMSSGIPVTLTLTMQIGQVRTDVSVTAIDQAALVDIEATGTRTSLSLATMEKAPVSIGTRGLEAVLLTFPGFAQNANGAIHPRGAHNQMTYVVDGLPISDQLTGAFGSALDPNMAQSVELITGNVPSEYGAKVSGVATIATKSGQGSGRRLFGSTEMEAAQFDTLGNSTQVGGEKGRMGYFFSVFALKTNRFLDQVVLDNLQNGGNSERFFGRFDYSASARDSFRFSLTAGRSGFELANLPSQHLNGQQQRQLLRDAAVWGAWVRTLDARSTLETTLSYRTSIAQLYSSAGDTPVTADQARHLSTAMVNTRYSRVEGRHNIRAGFDYSRIPVSENFSFGITNSGFNDPGNADYRPSLRPYDLTRGGRRFYFSDKQGGDLVSGFFQDQIKAGNFVIQAGLRYDYYRFLARGSQWQPRVGISYRVPKAGTVLRASYNRNYQTPPNENLLLSSSASAAALAPEEVRSALNGGYQIIQPQRENVYEVGLQQPLFGRLSLNATYYHKDSADQQDNDNFLNTGIIFPVTLNKIRVNGAEGRIVLPAWRNWNASVSFTHSRAISTPPFTGGLYLNQGAVELLTAGPFVIDHDQKLAVQSTMSYQPRRWLWFSGSVRYDSGLVANQSDPAEVAADPDFRDLLPYVDLQAFPARTRPRTIIDAGIGFSRYAGDRKRWDLQVQANNLTDRIALFNFQSIFVGTRVVAPRVVGVKFRVYF